MTNIANEINDYYKTYILALDKISKNAGVYPSICIDSIPSLIDQHPFIDDLSKLPDHIILYKTEYYHTGNVRQRTYFEVFTNQLLADEFKLLNPGDWKDVGMKDCQFINKELIVIGCLK